MTRYIALLRGINVGGNNPVKMAELRVRFEEAGFVDVTTYINSGNVLFSVPEADGADLAVEVAELRARCETLVAKHFGVNNPIFVTTAADLCAAVAQAPAWWGDAPDVKHNALFVLPPLTAEEACVEVGELAPEYEQTASWGQVVFWSAPLATFNHTRWAKVVGSDLYRQITIRNANTTKKLAQLATV